LSSQISTFSIHHLSKYPGNIMTHSRFMTSFRRAFLQAHQANIHSDPQSKTKAAKLKANWSRRRFIKLAALASGSALATRGLGSSAPAWGSRSPRIAIIGGGIAGLNAAYQLKKAGLLATVYEARRRVGGRIQSVVGAVGPGVVSDLGGHFINTDHEDMLTLANEFGLSLFNRPADAATLPFPAVAYYFDGSLQPEAAVADKLRPLATQILADAIALDEDFDRVARRLDRLSVTQYLNQYDDLIPEPFIRVLIENSIRTEYGVEPEDSSALQLIFNLPLVEGNEVEVLGASDEVFVLEGGSARLTDSLAAALNGQVQTNMRLTELRRQGREFRLAFGSTKVTADYVVMAIPFTVLRHIEVKANLPGKLRQFIDEVDLGSNEKVLAGFEDRIWRQEGGFTQEVWTDLSFAQAWDGSQRQPALPESALTFYFGGDQAADILKKSTQSQGNSLLRELDSIVPGAKDTSNRQFLRTAWTEDPFSLGAYSNFKPGQLTEFASFFYIESDDPQERQEVRVGNLIFAGEQVSDAFYGFMNGGAETGRLAAETIIRDVLGPEAVTSSALRQGRAQG
jgi:monoamine oxidase